jgi:OOP family OmpA-OmpF porin
MKRFAAGVLFAFAPLLGAQDVLGEGVYFPSGSASLTADGYEVLRAVAAAMQADPAMRLEVEGHADTSASARTNLPLSQQRAEAAREFLVSLGVAPQRLVAKGYGAYRPVNDNGTLERRAWNRRVQFRRLDR